MSRLEQEKQDKAGKMPEVHQYLISFTLRENVWLLNCR